MSPFFFFDFNTLNRSTFHTTPLEIIFSAHSDEFYTSRTESVVCRHLKRLQKAVVEWTCRMDAQNKRNLEVNYGHTLCTSGFCKPKQQSLQDGSFYYLKVFDKPSSWWEREYSVRLEKTTQVAGSVFYKLTKHHMNIYK